MKINPIILIGGAAVILLALARGGGGAGLVKGGKMAQIKPNVRFIQGDPDGTYTGGFSGAEVFEGFTAVVQVSVGEITQATRAFWASVADLAPDVAFEIIAVPSVTEAGLGATVPGNDLRTDHPYIYAVVNDTRPEDHLDIDGVPRGSNAKLFAERMGRLIDGLREKYASLLPGGSE